MDKDTIPARYADEAVGSPAEAGRGSPHDFVGSRRDTRYKWGIISPRKFASEALEGGSDKATEGAVRGGIETKELDVQPIHPM